MLGRACVGLLLGLLVGCGGGGELDCSLHQGWSDEVLSSLTSEYPPFPPLQRQGFGLNMQAGVPVVRGADGGVLPSVIASESSLDFPVSVESVGLDGGFAPFQFHAFLDGEPLSLTLVQDGGVAPRPGPDLSGVATFGVSVPEPVAIGAHDLVLVAIRERPVLSLGGAFTWLYGGTNPQGALAPSTPTTAIARTGNGSVLRAADGSFVAFPARQMPESGGAFSWTAQLEDESEEATRSCRGSVRRHRLIALLDGAPWPFAGGQYHLDVDIPVGTAAEVPVGFTGLPSDQGHALAVMVQQNAGRFQVRPDGTAGPWFNMLVRELGAAWW